MALHGWFETENGLYIKREGVCEMEEVMRCGKSILGEKFCKTAELLFLAVLTIICGVSASNYFSSDSDFEENSCKYYTSVEIEAGDSLWSIASEYMTEEYENVQDYVDEIKSLNRLANDKIHAGKYLVIPYYSRQ